MIRTTSLLFQISILAAFICGGCHSGNEEGSGVSGAAEEAAVDALEEVRITRAQFEASRMQLGNSGSRTFRQVVKANGYIEASPQGIARVTTLVPGRVTEIYVAVGEKVGRGQRLFYIEGNELIKLQQDYAESANKLKLLHSTYKRQQALTAEDISAEKELISAENEYNSMLVRLGGLKAQLRLLQIDPADVEAGKIYSGVRINSPVSGYISEMDLMLGKVIEPHESVVEIVDPGKMQLNVHVYENALDDMASGQEVRFYKPEQPGNVFGATLQSVGRTVDNEARTIHCIAKLEAANGQQFVHGLFVEAEVITSERDAEAIPETALINEHEKHFVLVKTSEFQDQLVFKKRPVEIGVIQNGYVELPEGHLENVLIEGSYNIAGN